MCFHIEICLPEVNLLVKGFTQLKSFHCAIIYVLAGLGSGRVNVPFLTIDLGV
jgi:hypothetical protein